MGPPVDPAAPQPPAPPGPPGPPGQRGFPVAPGGPPPSRWTWQRLLVIGGAVVVVGLVIAAVVLATRKPAPSTPQAIATPSASPSASPSPSDTPTPTPTATARATATPTAKATPTATQAPQNTPTQQANVLFPANGSGTGTECGANGTYSGCPVTSTLIDAANQWRAHHAAAPQPLCRCPSTYSSPFAQQNDTLLLPGDQGNPDRAAVQVSLTLSSGTENMVVLFVRQGGMWLAADTYCGPRMNTLSSGAPTTC